MCAVFVKGREQGRGSSAGLRKTEGEECISRIVSAEKELREALLYIEFLTNTLNEYKFRVRNSKRLDGKELNTTTVLWELKRV